MIFFVENTLRIILYLIWGIMTFDSLLLSLKLLPMVLLALFLGMQSGRFLSEKAIRKVVIVMLMISGLALIFNNL